MLCDQFLYRIIIPMKCPIMILLLLFCFSGVSQKACFSDCSKLFSSPRAAHPDSTLNDLKGCTAPEIRALRIDDFAFDSKDLDGKIVVINFWYAACKPCVAEIPGLNRLAEEFKNQNVVFLAFGRDDPPAILEFLKQRPFLFQHIPKAQPWADKFCVVLGWPTNLIIDQKGRVVFAASGGRTDEKAPDAIYHRMAPVIQRLLK